MAEAALRLPRWAATLVRAAGDVIALRGGRGRRLCIVNYHRILESFDPLHVGEPGIPEFRWQMRLLADCFNVMPLDAGLAAMAAGRLPPRAVCITFDDGYRSTHDLALPILKEFGLPAAVFITTGFVGDGNMWNDTIREAVRKVSGDTLDLSARGLGVFAIGTPAQRKLAVDQLTEQAKYLPPAERQALTDELSQSAARAPTPHLMLTTDMIHALAASGIEIGAHTVSHPILTRLDETAARHEIEESKRRLEELSGRKVRFFAYPNGKFGIDFDQRHMDLARQAGFEAAFSTASGAASAGLDRFCLPRSLPWDPTPFWFATRLLRWLAA